MQQENNFQDLQMFEDTIMNEVCDSIINYVNKISEDEVALCGSIAKVLSQQLPDTYRPKDVDFVVSKAVFLQLTRIKLEIDNVVTIEKQPNRIILYTNGSACIELWIFDHEDVKKEKKYYKNKIPYLI